MTTPLTNTRILLAEDERHVRMLLRVVLEAAGATVVEAEDGSRALRLLELETPAFDLVLTDLNMPNMDGEALVNALRVRWPELPVVVCSARTLPQSAPSLCGRVQGAVMKPFIPSELVRTLAQALASPSAVPRAAAV